MRGKVEICGINTADLKVLKNDEMMALLRRCREGDKSAREQLICGNLRLVLSVIQRFLGRGENVDDLFQVGCIGLIKALDNFDTTLNVKFSTYAVPMITGEIKRFLRDDGMLKVSRSLKELGLKVNAERERCLKHTGQEPGVTQLAEILQTTPEQIALAIRASLPALSLTPGNDEDSNREWDVPVDSPEETLADRIGLREVMDKLEPKDRELIRLRFFGNRTQTETARILGSTQVQISRRERKILAWMRVQLLEI